MHMLQVGAVQVRDRNIKSVSWTFLSGSIDSFKIGYNLASPVFRCHNYQSLSDQALRSLLRTPYIHPFNVCADDVIHFLFLSPLTVFESDK